MVADTCGVVAGADHELCGCTEHKEQKVFLFAWMSPFTDQNYTKRRLNADFSTVTACNITAHFNMITAHCSNPYRRRPFSNDSLSAPALSCQGLARPPTCRLFLLPTTWACYSHLQSVKEGRIQLERAVACSWCKWCRASSQCLELTAGQYVWAEGNQGLYWQATRLATERCCYWFCTSW